MLQQGQVLKLKSKGANGEALWAYRYRLAGRDSKRVQRGGFRTERDAREALERELEVLRRIDGPSTTRRRDERSSCLLSPGTSFTFLPRRSARTTARWCCSRRRPGFDPASGSRSSAATSIARRESSTCAARYAIQRSDLSTDRASRSGGAF
jgi:hypothetical protein